MTSLIFWGAFGGFIIPFLARRFAKFMPATMAMAWIRIPLKPTRFKRKKAAYSRKRRQYLLRSLLYALIGAFLFAAAEQCFYSEGLSLILWFLWILMLAAEVDFRTYLLPDMLTWPLLVLGFLYAAVYGGWISAPESAIGAGIGYFLPVIASLPVILLKKQEVFGGGDVKLLSALGAWFGVDKLLSLIILSTVLFFIYALIRRKKDGAFGPAIALSAIIIAFGCF